MNVLKDWVLTELAGEYVAVPTGESASFRGVVRLNETGCDIWNGLTEGKTEQEIAQQLVGNYENLTFEKALADVKSVIAKLQKEALIDG